MYQEDIRLAIDVGSTKICSVVIRTDNSGAPEMLALNVMPCNAMSRGDMADIRTASEVIHSSVQEASQQCDLNFGRAYVAIGGKHVRSFAGWGKNERVNFAAGVTEQDISNAVRDAAATHVEVGDHLLYATPVRYRIDGTTQFRKPPIGMHPDLLEVQTHLVVCDVEHYKAVSSAVEAAGIEPIHGGATIVAEAEQLLTQYERDSGAVMIDIGGNDTELAVYQDGRNLAVRSLPIGGFHYTNDIAIGYEIPFENAEAVKLSSGTVSMATSEQDFEIDPHQLTGNEKVVDVERSISERSLSKVSVSQLLRERMAEMAKMIRKRIYQIDQLRDKELITIAFTGGGAKLDGFPSAMKIAMTMRGKVELRKPTGVKSLPESVSDPTMSGAICVMLRALRLISQDNHVTRKPAPPTPPRIEPPAPAPEKQEPRKGIRSILRR